MVANLDGLTKDHLSGAIIDAKKSNLRYRTDTYSIRIHIHAFSLQEVKYFNSCNWFVSEKSVSFIRPVIARTIVPELPDVVDAVCVPFNAPQGKESGLVCVLAYISCSTFFLRKVNMCGI